MSVFVRFAKMTPSTKVNNYVNKSFGTVLLRQVSARFAKISPAIKSQFCDQSQWDHSAAPRKRTLRVASDSGKRELPIAQAERQAGKAQLPLVKRARPACSLAR